MRRNYPRKLSASTYINDAENVGIIGILAYPKTKVFIFLIQTKNVLQKLMFWGDMNNNYWKIIIYLTDYPNWLLRLILRGKTFNL